MVRFEGNGYSKEWAIEAKNRGLYVNEEFIDIFDKIDEACEVFVKVGACSKKEMVAKCEVMRENYVKTVETETQCIIDVATQQIIPRAYRYSQSFNVHETRPSIVCFSKNFLDIFDNSLQSLGEL
jgi:glutamine synthetase